MYASNSHSYTHLILALGIVREPTVWNYITSQYLGIHDIGPPSYRDRIRVLCVVCAVLFCFITSPTAYSCSVSYCVHRLRSEVSLQMTAYLPPSLLFFLPWVFCHTLLFFFSGGIQRLSFIWSAMRSNLGGSLHV